MNKRLVVSLGVIFFVTLVSFRLLIVGRVPIPLDALVGLYHPYRDQYVKEYPRGLPYKNPLITDPVLQQIPWRDLSITQLKNFQLPLWNPYAFSGYPLLGNIQSAPFYPLNIVFLMLPFLHAWTTLIVLQVILGGSFMYLYLRRRTAHIVSPILGALAFAFSGFFISWMEWGTVAQTGLWLPLLLLCIDHMIEDKKKFWWQLLLVLTFFCSFSAGHLQTFVYVFLTTTAYSLYRLYQDGFKAGISVLYSVCTFLVISSVLWFPQIQFILLSGRDADLSWQKEGFFIPFQHLIQFVAPDFFGNPATGNYFGVWNYGEMVGYVGLTALLLSSVTLLKRSKDTLFFLILFIVALLFSVDTVIAHLPYVLHLPFISSTQPTRLIFVIDFCLAILAAKGLDEIIVSKKRHVLPLVLGAVIFLGFLFLFPLYTLIGLDDASWSVTRRNLILPLVFLITFEVLYGAFIWIKRKSFQRVLPYTFLLLIILELLFVTNKYNSFSSQKYFYPSTKALSFLASHLGNSRVMSVDRRALPANISVWYKFQSISGYDPLYLERYGEYISALQRNRPDIQQPFGFQRIITPDNVESPLIDLLGVKYIVSLSDIRSVKLKQVFADGETRIYENIKVFDRSFFVKKVTFAKNKQDTINQLFSLFDLRSTAVVEDYSLQSNFSVGKVSLVSYSENSVRLLTENSDDGFLILTDIAYPTWHASVDGKEVPIYRADYLFRGVVVPRGSHTVQFNSRLFSL